MGLREAILAVQSGENVSDVARRTKIKKEKIVKFSNLLKEIKESPKNNAFGRTIWSDLEDVFLLEWVNGEKCTNRESFNQVSQLLNRPLRGVAQHYYMKKNDSEKKETHLQIVPSKKEVKKEEKEIFKTDDIFAGLEQFRDNMTALVAEKEKEILVIKEEFQVEKKALEETVKKQSQELTKARTTITQLENRCLKLVKTLDETLPGYTKMWDQIKVVLRNIKEFEEITATAREVERGFKQVVNMHNLEVIDIGK